MQVARSETGLLAVGPGKLFWSMHASRVYLFINALGSKYILHGYMDSCLGLKENQERPAWETSKLPVGSYPTPVLGHLLFYIAETNHKTRYPKKGVGHEPLGTIRNTKVCMEFEILGLTALGLTVAGFTCRLQCSSFLGLPFRING